MNNCSIIGRLTRDPELRYTSGNTAVCTFTLAVDRPVKAGSEKQTDFPRITTMGKLAENCHKYLKKGKLAGVEGSFRTEKYQKNGVDVYSAGIFANRVEFLSWDNNGTSAQQAGAPASGYATEVPAPTDSGSVDFMDFEYSEEDCPF